MSRGTCPHEDAVLAAPLEGPDVPLSRELVDHLVTCESCRDLHVIASALHDDHAAAMAEARLPSAGQVWWRAELRARQEAATAAARPITVVTGVALACVVGLFASVAGVLVWWLRDAFATPAAQLVTSSVATASSWPVPDGARVLLWLIAGVLLLATPVVLYVAFREE